MAFIDELKIFIKAGHGGHGVERWLHEKFRDKGGPAGGNGGKGGDVYLHAVRNVGLLQKYAHKDEFVAQNGEAGRNRSQYGRNGEDLFIEMPVGSIVTNLSTGEVFKLDNDGEDVLILRGGQGGLGNEHFKGPENQRPIETTNGKPGQEAYFHIELELIADAGFIGFPNAGKSSLLNALTNANSKIGSYQFTTLEPHLGSMHGVILADIPGLIEGASEGKGLGHKFLKHIRRTRMLIHCIALDEEGIRERYDAIRKELGEFDQSLLQKPELIVLTKLDEVDEDSIKKARKELPKESNIIAVSVLEEESVKKLGETISTLISH